MKRILLHTTTFVVRLRDLRNKKTTKLKHTTKVKAVPLFEVFRADVKLITISNRVAVLN
jgi:hypothetical protein